MKKLFTFLIFTLCTVVNAWGDAVGDLKTISTDFTFIADNITNNGTTALSANTLYADGYIFTPKGNTVATNKGSSTIDGENHLNSLRVKNTQDQLAFKVDRACKVTFYTQSHDSRGIQVGSSEGGTQYGTQTFNTTEFTCNITAGGVVYLSSLGGDFYFAGFKVIFTEPSSLAFAKTSGTADIAEGTSFTLPTLTKVPVDLDVTFTSSNPLAATVDAETGAVTLVGVGVTDIKASFAGNSTYSASDATYTLTVTNSAAAEVTVTYDISGVAGIQGEAPEAFDALEGSSFNIPVNQSLYIDGKTLSGWNDGSTTYSIGETVTVPSTNMTLTPVFTTNTVTLSDRTKALTLKWDFQRKNGAPTFNKQGAGGTGVYVIQAAVANETIDVCMNYDATSGKIANANWEDWCQMNVGTVLTIPSEKEAVVSVEAYNVLGESSSPDVTDFLTIDGSTDYSHAKVINYTVTSETSTIDVVIGKEGTYYRYLQVVLPLKIDAVTNKTWNMSDYVGQTVTENSAFDNLEFASNVVIDNSNKSYGTEFSSSKRAKTGAVGSKTSRFLHFKVAGSSKITVYGMSANSSNARNIVIDANGTELLNVKLTGDVLNKVETFYFGTEKDIYLYSTDGGINIHGIKVEALPATVAKTITSAGYATLYSEYPLNFDGTGLTAYIATIAGTTATFSPVTSVPAKTGVLLKGAATSYNIPVAASSTDVSSNKFEGVLEETEKAAESVFILMNGAQGIGFYKNSAAFKVGANTAYLPADVVANAKTFIGFDEAMGIESLKTEKTANSQWFNLAGQRVVQPKKGLYIQNGKKVIVK